IQGPHLSPRQFERRPLCGDEPVKKWTFPGADEAASWRAGRAYFMILRQVSPKRRQRVNRGTPESVTSRRIRATRRSFAIEAQKRDQSGTARVTTSTVSCSRIRQNSGQAPPRILANSPTK